MAKEPMTDREEFDVGDEVAFIYGKTIKEGQIVGIGREGVASIWYTTYRLDKDFAFIPVEMLYQSRADAQDALDRLSDD